MRQMDAKLYVYRVKQLVEVHDGDTVSLVLNLGFHLFHEVERMRLLGIDTPELDTVTPDGRHLGVLARDYLADLLTKGHLYVQTTLTKDGDDRMEKYGGVLGVLLVETPDHQVLDCNALMIQQGHAVPYLGGRKSLNQRTGLLEEWHG